MIYYLTVAGIGIVLVGIWALVSKYFLTSTLPDFKKYEVGSSFESAGGAAGVDQTQQIIQSLTQQMTEMKDYLKSQDKKAFWRSILASGIFYIFGLVTSVYGDPVASLLQTAVN